MKKKSSPPTIKDVAAKAGVSIGTVSKVINHRPVGEQYEKKVKKAIEELSFTANRSAKSLRSQKNDVAAVILPDTINRLFGMFAFLLNTALYERGYSMLLCCSGSDKEYEAECVRQMCRSGIDGIIGIFTGEPEVPESMPVIAVGADAAVGKTCVTADHMQGGRLAAEALSEAGCTNTLCIDDKSFLFQTVKDRAAGKTRKRKYSITVQ